MPPQKDAHRLQRLMGSVAGPLIKSLNGLSIAVAQPVAPFVPRAPPPRVSRQQELHHICAGTSLLL